ncbi:MAG: hypothetical protein KAV00_09315, partial [Phycisphaerae bacterium]|nr:hypothetical protein [Phycisphaerae bacterium]
RTLASAGADTTIILWNIDPWVCRSDRDKTSPLKMDACKPAYLWDKLKGKEESSDHNEYAIMWVLVRAGDKAVGLLDIFLKPVRVNSESVKRLIADLDDDEYKVRKRASEELAGFGNAIDSDIREALKKPTSLEAKIRLEAVLKVVSYPLPNTPESLRKYRSVQILEWIGTKKAQGVLKKLAAGHAGASLTQDAKSALARIASRNR